MKKQFILTCLLASAFLATAANADTKFPGKTIKFIAPFGAGASSDTIARLIAAHLSKSLHNPVIVENKPGASGLIGTSSALREPTDGHAILIVGSAPMVFNPLTFAKLPYDQNDLLPVSIIADYPLVIAANKNSGINNLNDLTVMAKSKPKEISYSFTSPTFQAQMEYLNKKLGIELMPVPYNGGGAALQAVLAGHTHLIAQDPTSIIPLHKSGGVKAIAVTSLERNPQLPDVPTVAESGLKGFETGIFMGIAVHRKTPADVVEKIYQEVYKVLQIPEVRNKILDLGMNPLGLNPRESAERITREKKLYKVIVDDANMIVNN